MHGEASVGYYLSISRGVTHQQAAPSGGGQKLLQGHFSVLDPSMQFDLCCYPGKQEVIPMQCSLKTVFLSAMRKYLMRARQVWDESHLEVGCYPVKLNLVPRSAPRLRCL